MDMDQPETHPDQTIAESSDQQPLLLGKGNALKILDQTIDDGGAVKYTVLWESGATTEVRDLPAPLVMSFRIIVSICSAPLFDGSILCLPPQPKLWITLVYYPWTVNWFSGML